MDEEMTDEDIQYYKQPYHFFSAEDDWFELMNNGHIGPWYIVPVHALAHWYDGNLESCAVNGFKLAQWWNKKAKGTDIVFYRCQSKAHHLIFDNEVLATAFATWYNELPEQIRTDRSRDLWPGRDNFLDEVEKTGKMAIEGKLDVVELVSYYNRDILTKEIFDIYCWLEENTSKVYYWGEHFYFTEDTDATAFKLKWL